MKTLQYALRGLTFSTLSLSITTTAFAGADLNCQPSLNLLSNQFDTCNSLPILDPANDSQVNTVLLLKRLGLAKVAPLAIDQDLYTAEYGLVPFEAKMMIEHSSNAKPNARRAQIYANDTGYEQCGHLKTGAVEFNQRVEQYQALSTVEKQSLMAMRGEITECFAKYPFIKIDSTQSVPYKQYASYINGVIAFYNGDFTTAENIFLALKNAKDAWLKETAHYMVIRSQLNKVYQAATDTYGDLNVEQLNQTHLAHFFQSIQQYLKLYPRGQYVASARGFLRRGYWLLGRQDLLMNEMVWQINHSTKLGYNLEMDNFPAEIDRRIFQSGQFNAEHLKDPFFLSIYLLMQLREPSSSDQKPISWQSLNTYQKNFKAEPQLFRYLQAIHLFFIQNKTEDALNLIPQKLKQNNVLDLSFIVLKGRILEKINAKAAYDFWQQQFNISKTPELKALFEFALFHHEKSKQDPELILGNTAKIQQLNLQRRYITHHANLDTLAKIVHAQDATQIQKDVALETWLNIAVIKADFTALHTGLKALPKNVMQYKGYDSQSTSLQSAPELAIYTWNGTTISSKLECPNLLKLSEDLSQQPNDLSLKLCLGEFVRSNSAWRLREHYWQMPEQAQQKSHYFSRGAVYREIIAEQAKGELHAYALYRSVMCYAPAGINDCQDIEVPKSTRQQWFNQLKKQYPNSTWAKSLKFYW